MKKINKKYFVAVGVIFFCLLIILFVYTFGDNKNDFDKQSTISEITETILNSSDEEELGNSNTVQVTHVSSKYARAESESGTNFYLINVENNWKSVFVSSDPVFCERAEKFGFPIDFIDDCVLEYPDAIELSDYSEEGNDDESTVIISNISENQDPFCDCLILEDDGTEIDFDYEGNIPGDPGDTVVIVVEDGEIVEVVDVIDDDIDEDDEDDEEDEDDEDDGPIIYINSDPETAPPDEKLFFLDIDQSDREIQLITDL
jgi:hypothetical protein